MPYLYNYFGVCYYLGVCLASINEKNSLVHHWHTNFSLTMSKHNQKPYKSELPPAAWETKPKTFIYIFKPELSGAIICATLNLIYQEFSFFLDSTNWGLNVLYLNIYGINGKYDGLDYSCRSQELSEVISHLKFLRFHYEQILFPKCTLKFTYLKYSYWRISWLPPSPNPPPKCSKLFL